jgi:hypothetical protein
MATSGKAPFNIRKVNGQWMFTEGVFGGQAQYSLFAPELRIVPESLIPDQVYAGGKTGYIPESQIVAYFQSDKFAETAARIARVHPEGILAAGRGVDPTTAARSISAMVKNALSDVDEANHAVRAKAAKKTDTVEKSPPMTVVPTYGMSDPANSMTTPWTSGVSLAHDPTSGLMLNVETGQLLNKNSAEVFMLPDPGTDRLGSPQMKLSDKVIQATDLMNRITKMPSNTIKVWEKALGLPVTGAYSDTVAKSILNYARLATQRNWTRSLSGDTGGFKPVSEMDMLLEDKKAGKLGGGSKSSTTTTTTRFNVENSGAFITDMFQQLVGRDPSQQEQQQWVEKLTAAAKKKPSVSTTTRIGQNYSTTSETGFTEASAQQMVRNQLAMSPESQSLMASTNLYDAFLQAIQNPMG